MKLLIEQSDDRSEVEITIRCGAVIDPALERLIRQIRLFGYALPGKKENQTVFIRPEDIFYFETVDGKTFVYCEKDVYECEIKLYEAEQRLSSGSFVRISKSSLLNMSKLKGFQTKLNGKLEAHLQNGERLEVNRHYVAQLKERLMEARDIK
ncbi:MAG: LytTR family DNA-binding domain-containing protein [Methanocorpusculum sp.]|nr:LytTR family DNA-binding domain-containing protein [Methanocorpusculum sp.]